MYYLPSCQFTFLWKTKYGSEIVSPFPKNYETTLHDPPCPLTGRGFRLQKHIVSKQNIYNYADCKISFSVQAGKRTLGVKKVANRSHADVIITWHHTHHSYQNSRVRSVLSSQALRSGRKVHIYTNVSYRLWAQTVKVKKCRKNKIFNSFFSFVSTLIQFIFHTW